MLADTLKDKLSPLFFCFPPVPKSSSFEKAPKLGDTVKSLGYILRQP